jgi:hypothetical protein
LEIGVSVIVTLLAMVNFGCDTDAPSESELASAPVSVEDAPTSG